MSISASRSVALWGDKWVLWLASLAAVIGAFSVLNAGYAASIRRGEGILSTEFKKHVIWLLIAIFVYAVVCRIRWVSIQKRSALLFVFALVLCVLVFVPGIGYSVRGAHRWIDLRVGLLQPSEIMKPILILFTASVLIRALPPYGKRARDWIEWMDGRLVPAMVRAFPWVVILLAIYLIEREPDLGSATAVALCVYGVMVLGKVRISILVAIALLALGAFWVFTHSKGYRADRLLYHSSRWEAESVNSFGFQPAQSEKAMAVGGIAGVGVGKGQAKHVLPAATTDYAFTTVGEEFGIWGALLVIGLLGGLALRLILLSSKAPTPWCRMVIGGVGWWIGTQSAVNLLMVGAAVPSVGIPLPFISYGGSSLIALAIGLGCANACALASEKWEGANAHSRNRRRHGRTRLTRA